MHSSFIRYTFASGKHFSFIAGLCTVLCFMLWGGVAQAQMDTNLAGAANGGLIPVTYDYTDADGNAASETVDNAESINVPATGSGVGVVDWIEVQIRVIAKGQSIPTAAPADAAAVSYASYIKPAWLLSDGLVVDVNSDIAAINSGTGGELTIPTDANGLTFDATTQDLYVLVNHRNHLAIMSSVAVPADDPDISDVTIDDPNIYEYDFSAAFDTAVGNTQTGGPLVFRNSVYAIRAGSVTDDNRINTLDDPPAIAGVFNAGITSGYQLHDVNLDGRINLLDDPPISARNAPESSPITY